MLIAYPICQSYDVLDCSTGTVVGRERNNDVSACSKAELSINCKAWVAVDEEVRRALSAP